MMRNNIGLGIAVALFLSVAVYQMTLEKEIVPVPEDVLSQEGVVLSVSWNGLGARMVESGVIDQEKFERLYEQRGGLTQEERVLLEPGYDGPVRMTQENSGVLLNLLWAFGLANENPVLTQGPMKDNTPYYASTGGWTVARDSAMDHYAAHRLLQLSQEQQETVERVSEGIFRPCCGNSTHFPDCNHGMAMLGLLELMAADGVSQDEMYEVALKANSYWFPDTYLTLAQYFAQRGVKWEDVSPQVVLGSAYSSAQGFAQILQEMRPEEFRGSSCGV